VVDGIKIGLGVVDVVDVVVVVVVKSGTLDKFNDIGGGSVVTLNTTGLIVVGIGIGGGRKYSGTSG
jgi:hypothetical protein